MRARFLLAIGLFALSAAVPGSATPASPLAQPMPATADHLEGALHGLASEERGASERRKDLSEENVELEALLVAKGRAYVKLTRAGLLPIGGGLEALVDHASRLERLRRSLSRALDRQKAVARERLALSQSEQELSGRRTALEAERGALERSRTAILAAEEREAAFRRAFLGQGSSSPHTAVYSGFGPTDPDAISDGFSSQKGRLPFPLEGRAEIRPGHLGDADGPGLDMVAPAGTAVRAVAGGKVTFADSHAAYGLTVILDHGDGYSSVSANLGGVDVRVGDAVPAGGRLGTVGVGPRGALLHFELRKGKGGLDASSWFGI